VVGEHDIPERRRALRDRVTQLAWDLGRAVREARKLNLPVEPGVRDARTALPLGRPARPGHPVAKDG
jgi:hypothetical protein